MASYLSEGGTVMRRATIILLALVLILAEAGTAYAATGKREYTSGITGQYLSITNLSECL